MRVIIVTPIWKRPILTAHYLTQLQLWKTYARVMGVADLLAVIVGSEKETSKALVGKRTGIYYIECPNEPLGAKFNAGIKKAMELRADYVLIMGSDQFADESILRHYGSLMRKGVQYAGPLDTYVWEPETGRAVYWPGYTNERNGMPVGPGRLIHRDLLEPMGGELYDPDLIRNLDGSADSKLPAPVTFEGKPYLFVSVKSGESITPFEAYEGEEADSTMFYELLRAR